MNSVQLFAMFYVFVFASLLAGYVVGKYEVFPYTQITEIEEFFIFQPESGDLSVREKIEHEANINPAKFIYPQPKHVIENAVPMLLPDANDRRDAPSVYISPEHRAGYRAIFGAMDFENSVWGGILISGDSEIAHSWKLSSEEVLAGEAPGHQLLVYGLHLLRDGSVIYILQSIDDGGYIVKVDACGRVQWTRKELYHHAVSVSLDESYFWTYKGRSFDFHHKLAKIDSQSGKILQVIDMQDVYKRNPFIHIFNLQRDSGLFTAPVKMKDISHGNDIDELEVSQADQFPGFEAGDLLLSYRNQNLIFIIDPDTLAVKWWRIGAADRQHDTDWENGFITTFSNNAAGSRRGSSDVVRINPGNMVHDVVLDGSKFNMFSWFNGRQQLAEQGTRIATSATQGWALEVDAAQEIVFSYLNVYSKENKSALHLSESYRLPEDYFEENFWGACE